MIEKTGLKNFDKAALHACAGNTSRVVK